MKINLRSEKIFFRFISLIIIPIFIFFNYLSSTEKYGLKERKIEGPAEEIIFSKPVDIQAEGSKVFILDSQECQVRVFSSEGKWLYNLGRYGQGPGEFIGSSDMDVAGDEIALLDSEGRRVNFYGLDGSPRGEFKIGFKGHRLVILSKDRFLVTYMPQVKEKNAFLIHGFNRQGQKLLATQKISSSGQTAFDFFLFQHFLIKLSGQPVLVKMFNPEMAVFLNENGEPTKAFKADPALPVIEFQPPLPRPRKIQAFFWYVSAYENKIYLVLPGRMEDGDIGPSSRVAVLDAKGKLENFIDFPFPVFRLARVGNHFFVLDEAACLHFFDLIEEKI